MKQASLEQLDWGPERYAQLPTKPILIDLIPAEGQREHGFARYLLSAVLTVGYILFESQRVAGLYRSGRRTGWDPATEYTELFITIVVLVAIWVGPSALISIWDAVTRASRNHGRLQENARRQRAYEEAVARSVRLAVPKKAAEDHRLGLRIRELEALARTVAEKEAGVSQLLRSL